MKVLVADDHPMVRSALAHTVRDVEPDVEVIEADTFQTVCEAVQCDQPDMALIDLNMPGMNAIEGLRRLRQRFPTLVLVVASGQQDTATIRAVLELGALGFIPKTESRDVILMAIRLVRAGGTYIPKQTLQIRSGAPAQGAATASRGPGSDNLTPRQFEVLQLLGQGQPNKLIARELGLTEGTVKIHLAAILRSLEARNRTEAVVRARKLGLLP
jgi:DNA-binding NarL/FixJ family response regulator